MLSCQVLEKLFGVSDPLTDFVESHQSSLGLSLSTGEARELGHGIQSVKRTVFLSGMGMFYLERLFDLSKKEIFECLVGQTRVITLVF